MTEVRVNVHNTAQAPAHYRQPLCGRCRYDPSFSAPVDMIPSRFRAFAPSCWAATESEPFKVMVSPRG